ncbi:MAG: sigma 54-interacting transcriptional regulator [Archangium sp.]|nr:sigma 54-interacting transcriptional regulator [Archangium sp.]
MSSPLDADDATPLPRGSTTQTVEVQGLRGPEAALSAARLKWTRGPDAGATWPFKSDRAVIGTHQGADVVLHDKAVSRYHCELRLEADGLAVRDLGSRNGTRVNGVLIERAWLAAGDRLQVGESEAVVELSGDQVRVALHASDSFGPLVGGSLAMRTLFARLARAASSNATVLLTGESGTGKELAAEAIHLASPRATEPLVVVDCGAVPPSLLESELFGHEKGAFTGAATMREGAFELADKGTLFLDEIGELPLDLQPKLLRALEKREIKRVGGSAYQPVDLRVVAATHRDLRAEVNSGRFRADLFYRLAVVEVRVPALRERTDDLPVLVRTLLTRLGLIDQADAAPLLSEPLLSQLRAHPWPGNVRELRNYLEKAVALGEATPPSAPVPAAGVAPVTTLDYRAAKEEAIKAFEKPWLEALMARHEGNAAAAARSCGLDRAYLYRLLWRHGLK